MHLGAEEDVPADRERQRVGPLKHHAELFADLHQLDAIAEDVVAHDFDRAGGANVAEALDDPIDAA